MEVFLAKFKQNLLNGVWNTWTGTPTQALISLEGKVS
jgi:hypothetical protein